MDGQYQACDKSKNVINTIAFLETVADMNCFKND